MRDDVERIAGVPGLEQNFASLQLAVADAGQNLFDLLGRQMAHQVGRRQQFDSPACIRLFARECVFAELGDVAYGRALLLQKQRCGVVDDGADGKAGADKGPRRASIETLNVERPCAFIRKLDRQRGNQGAGRKSQQTGKRTFRKRNIEADRRSQQRRGGGPQSKQGRHRQLVK